MGNSLGYIRYLDDFPAFPLTNVWTDIGGIQSRSDPKIYVVQTSATAIQRCMLMTTDPGDLVLDPTCGSGTTAYVAEQWGRRWITTDTSRVALALARTRLMAARYPAYLLADSLDGAAKEQALSGIAGQRREFALDIRQGFVCKRVPHVTLKSIAQNPDIKEGMTRDEIDRAIARRADVEVLVDQPYVDNKKVRVSGRFTVESLSPHRMLEDDRDAADALARAADPEAVQFETMILENLRKAGVQNGARQERIRFERLEPYAGTWLHADGEYVDGDGNTKRVAVSIGPQFGTVGAVQIGEAGIEAQSGLPFDLLIVAGFAFDPDAWTKASEFAPDLAERKVGKIRVLLARANPDLFMADELLKKTGAGNLFTVFGEPDVDVRPTGDGQWVVEIHGVDVYDPTRGEVRSSKGTDDVACWFIDTDYDNKSFFVRHAYFTGGNEPYESLRKALRADIDEAAWTTLYSTVSRPFPPPPSGQIAVKVIDHYGDEIIQVYPVPPRRLSSGS